MTQYATSKPTHPVTANDARLYWKLTAPVVGVVAVLGFLLNLVNLGDLLGGFLTFDYAHNAVHLLIAVVGIYLGFGGVEEALAKNAAKLFGVVYLLLAAVGFVSGDVFGVGELLGLNLELGENLIHVALGGYAAYVGFSA